jgi:uncharacterized protein
VSRHLVKALLTFAVAALLTGCDVFVRKVTEDANVIIIAIPGREVDGKKLIDALPAVLDTATAAGTRLGVIGGASGLQVAEGGRRLIDTPDFPEAAKVEAGSHAKVLEVLRESGHDADWFW